MSGTKGPYTDINGKRRFIDPEQFILASQIIPDPTATGATGELDGDVTGSFTANTIDAGAVTEAKIAPNTLSGLVAKNVAASATTGGLELTFYINVPNTSSNTDVVFTHKILITDMIFYKSTTAGGVSDTVQVDNGTGGNHITEALVVGGTANARKTFATLISTYSTIAAAGTLRVVSTSVYNCAGTLVIKGVRVA